MLIILHCKCIKRILALKKLFLHFIWVQVANECRKVNPLFAVLNSSRLFIVRHVWLSDPSISWLQYCIKSTPCYPLPSLVAIARPLAMQLTWHARFGGLWLATTKSARRSLTVTEAWQSVAWNENEKGHWGGGGRGMGITYASSRQSAGAKREA